MLWEVRSNGPMTHRRLIWAAWDTTLTA